MLHSTRPFAVILFHQLHRTATTLPLSVSQMAEELKNTGNLLAETKKEEDCVDCEPMTVNINVTLA